MLNPKLGVIHQRPSESYPLPHMSFDPRFQQSSDASFPVLDYNLIRYGQRPLILI